MATTKEHRDMAKEQPGFITRLLHWADDNRLETPTAMRALRVLLRVLIITIRGFRANELSLRAGALTYTILLSLVPLLAMSTALVKGMGGDNHLRQIVYDYIETLEKNATTAPSVFLGQSNTAPDKPPGDNSGGTNLEKSATPLTVHLRSAADRIFKYVDKTDFTTLGTIGVLFMLVTIIMVFDTIERAMNAIWQVGSGRTAMRMLTDYLALLVLMPVAINIGFAASTLIKSPALLNKIEPFLPAVGLQGIFLLMFPILSISLTLTICYMIFPNTRVHVLPALIGAFFAGSLWFLTQNVYITLQIGVSNYNAIYGSFATLPLFLVWLYLGWIFILTGAQVAYACQTHHNFLAFSTLPTPAEQLGAAFDILRLVFSTFDRQQPLTAATLPDHCPQHSSFLLTTTLNHLLDAGIIHNRERKKRLFPSLPADKLSNEDIIHAILGKKSPDTAGGRQCQTVLDAAASALPHFFTKPADNVQDSREQGISHLDTHSENE